ncbi:MAG: hypothetical protein U9P44_01870 [archaeon]|nr:hypothetical protein [archaeon]
MVRYILILLFFVFLVSGCVGDTDDGGISVSGDRETQIDMSDILVINRIDSIPSTTLKPDRQFTVRLETENLGKNSVNLIVGDDDGSMVLYDWCSDIFRLRGSRSFVMTPHKATFRSDNYDVVEIKPGALQFFEWDMWTPRKEDISAKGVTCDFKVQLSYDAVASTNAYVYFATLFEISRSIYTRRNMYLLGSNLATDGPLKINVVFDSDQPVPLDKNTWSASINMENIGEGIVNVKNLELILPDQIDTVGDGVDGTRYCDLDKAENLEINKGSSEVITCVFIPVKEDVLIATAYKVKAEAEYTYIIYDSLTINVEP